MKVDTQVRIFNDAGDAIAPSPAQMAEALAGSWAKSAIEAALVATNDPSPAAMKLLLAEQVALVNAHLEAALRASKDVHVKRFLKSLEPDEPVEEHTAIRDEAGRLVGTRKRIIRR